MHTSQRVLFFTFPQNRVSDIHLTLPETLIDLFLAPGAMETILTPLTHNHGNAKLRGLETWETLPPGGPLRWPAPYLSLITQSGDA